MRRSGLLALAVGGTLIAAAAVVGRRLWFFSDDWNIFADYHSGNLLEPFNGHLSLLPAGLYQAAFHTVGVGSYLPYRVLGLAALGVLAFQVARYSTARMGMLGAAVAVVAVMWNSAGTTNVMFPFLMNFSLPIAALLAMWWHLDALPHGGGTAPAEADHDPASGGKRSEAPAEVRHLAAIGVWAAVALATSGLGVVAIGAIALEFLLRRSPGRLWTALAVPTSVWFIWWLGHRSANQVSTDPAEVLPYFLRMLWGGTTSIAAGWAPGGILLAAGLVALVGTGAARSRRLDPRVASALAAAVAFAGLTALTRQDTVPEIPPDELRYGWTIGAYLVFAAVAAVPTLAGRSPMRTWREPLQSGRRPAPAAGAAAVVCFAVLALGAAVLLRDMGNWTDTVADAAPGLRSNAYAVEAAGADRVDPDAIIRPLSFVPVTAGAYLDAVADVGSPLAGATGEEIGGRADQRTAADELFFSAVVLELALEPVLARERDCAESVEAVPGSTVVLQAIPGTGAAALADPAVGVSRFGDEPAVTLELEQAVAAHTLRLPEDARVGTDVVVPYRIAGSGGVTACVDANPQGP
jgi:hypothetical protein